MTEDFEDRLPYLLRRVSTSLGHQVDRALRNFSLTHAQLGALSQLALVRPDALSGATLGQRNGVTPQSMSTAVAGLLERGLVDREPHPTHGRILQIRITPQGLDLLDQAQAEVWKAEDRALSFLGIEDKSRLAATLRTMMRELDLHLYRSATSADSAVTDVGGQR